MAIDITRAIKKAISTELKKVANPKKIRKATLKKAGELVRDDMIKRIQRGQQTIKGRPARWPAYKNPDRYPKARYIKKKYPSKRVRPVNLTLSGDFLNSLKVKAFGGARPRIRVGFFKRLSKLKEKGHREGARGQPERPIIPEANEQFRTVITRQAKKFLIDQVSKDIAK